VLALESTPYGVITTLVSIAKSVQSDTRSAHEPVRAALVKPEHAVSEARSNRTWLREAADLQVPLVKGDVLLVR
jgi:hypothetical protein